MTKIRLTAFFLLSACVGGLVASEYVAASFGFNPALGWSITRVAGYVVYWPFAFVPWAFRLDNIAPRLLDRADFIFLACMVPALAAMFWATRKARDEIPEFAPEAWGKKIDAKNADLLVKGNPGVIVGRLNGEILSFNGPEHQMVSGASRAGKGAGHVIPTLLNWDQSVFVYDPKAECYDITASFRRKFSHAFFMNFTRQDSACYNPLDAIRRGPTEVADIQNIVAILYDPAGTKQEPNFFDLQAMQLLTGLILHTMYAKPPAQRHLAAIRRLLSNAEATFTDMAQAAHRYKEDPDQPDGLAKDAEGNPIPEQIPEVAHVGNLILAMPERLRGDVVSTANSYLTVFADPIVADKTSRSDFTAGDLMCADHPVSLYFQVPPSDDDRLRPLTRLILSQTARSLMINLDHDAEGRPKKHKLLYLIDEFPSLGKLGFFARNLRVMAGYGIKAFITVQSFKDIVEAYGPHNTILDNMHVTVAMAAKDNETANKISQMLGEPVQRRKSFSFTNDRLFGRTQKTETEAQRRLMTPGEVSQLAYDTQLIIVTGAKPFKTKKIRYWQESPWSTRQTNIKAGERGPSQSADIDLPRAGGVVSQWATVQPLDLTIATAAEPNRDNQPVEDAAAAFAGAGLTFAVTDLDSYQPDTVPEDEI